MMVGICCVQPIAPKSDLWPFMVAVGQNFSILVAVCWSPLLSVTKSGNCLQEPFNTHLTPGSGTLFPQEYNISWLLLGKATSLERVY